MERTHLRINPLFDFADHFWTPPLHKPWAMNETTGVQLPCWLEIHILDDVGHTDKELWRSVVRATRRREGYAQERPLERHRRRAQV